MQLLSPKFILSMCRTAVLGTLASLVACGIAGAEGQTGPLPDPAVDAPLAATSGQATAVVAGGCFWGIQGVFSHLNGVISATSGYAGGNKEQADYETVSTGTTGHAESVRIVYDPSKVTYGQLLKVFFSVATNPTELNYQGPDHGTQYRSELFTQGPEQAKIADAYIKQLSAAHVYKEPIVTQVAPLQGFYEAEGYHQNYLALHPTNPYIIFNDLPKIAALKSTFPTMYH
jgi:peptide-methionine (S)-S-oxide reductase